MKRPGNLFGAAIAIARKKRIKMNKVKYQIAANVHDQKLDSPSSVHELNWKFFLLNTHGKVVLGLATAHHRNLTRTMKQVRRSSVLDRYRRMLWPSSLAAEL